MQQYSRPPARAPRRSIMVPVTPTAIPTVAPMLRVVGMTSALRVVGALSVLGVVCVIFALMVVGVTSVLKVVGIISVLGAVCVMIPDEKKRSS